MYSFVPGYLRSLKSGQMGRGSRAGRPIPDSEQNYKVKYHKEFGVWGEARARENPLEGTAVANSFQTCLSWYSTRGQKLNENKLEGEEIVEDQEKKQGQDQKQKRTWYLTSSTCPCSSSSESTSWTIYINKSKPLTKFPAKLIKALRASGWARRAHLMELKAAALRRS